MSKPAINNLDEQMARAFAKDAYRQMTEVTRERDTYKDIALRHQQEHDARHPNGRCTCTLCNDTAAAAKQKSCCVCGYAADGNHESNLYCARCLAEKQAEERGAL